MKQSRKSEEAALQGQCLGWLRLKGVFHWRANSGSGLRRGAAGATYPVRSNPAGTPDVLAVVPLKCSVWGVIMSELQTVGLLVGIEFKSASGRLRPAQRAWRDNAARAGVAYLEVRSLEDLVRGMAAWGVK